MGPQAALLLKRQQNSVPEDELDLGGDNSMADLIGDALNLEKSVHAPSVACVNSLIGRAFSFENNLIGDVVNSEGFALVWPIGSLWCRAAEEGKGRCNT